MVEAAEKNRTIGVIQELNAMKQQGIITEEEFDIKKKKLLDRI